MSLFVLCFVELWCFVLSFWFCLRVVVVRVYSMCCCLPYVRCVVVLSVCFVFVYDVVVSVVGVVICSVDGMICCFGCVVCCVCWLYGVVVLRV